MPQVQESRMRQQLASRAYIHLGDPPSYIARGGRGKPKNYSSLKGDYHLVAW